MIDIENLVIDKIDTAVKAVFGTATVYGTAVEAPESFPCVTVQETDNATVTASQDIALLEHHARVNYQIDIYSTAGKSQAKQILDIVDTTMQNMKFTRTMCGRTPNIDRTIYRITIRYTAIVGEPITDNGGNITYPMFRR